MPYTPVTNAEPWTEAENERLRKAYKRYQQTKDCWHRCAKLVVGRTDAQCRYRWLEYLRPDVIRDLPWSAEEEETMVDCVKNNVRMSKHIFNEHFPQRPHSFLRTHWRRVQRKLERKRECRSKRTKASGSPDKNSGSSKPPFGRGRSRRTARIDSPGEESDPEDVVITSHVLRASPSQPSPSTSSAYSLAGSSGMSPLQSSPQPAEPGMATYAGPAEDNTPLAAAFTLFCAPPALVGPAARDRAQEFLVEECVRSADHRVRIAITLLRPTASEQTRTLAEDVLLNSIHARLK